MGFLSSLLQRTVRVAAKEITRPQPRQAVSFQSGYSPVTTFSGATLEVFDTRKGDSPCYILAPRSVEDEWGEGITNEGYVVTNDFDRRFPWRTLPVTRMISFPVDGTDFHMRNLQSPEFTPGRRLSLVREPDNPDGSTVTAVYSKDGRMKIGYVPTELPPKFGFYPKVSDLIDAGKVSDCISMWHTVKHCERFYLRALLLRAGWRVRGCQ